MVVPRSRDPSQIAQPSPAAPRGPLDPEALRYVTRRYEPGSAAAPSIWRPTQSAPVPSPPHARFEILVAMAHRLSLIELSAPSSGTLSWSLPSLSGPETACYGAETVRTSASPPRPTLPAQARRPTNVLPSVRPKYRIMGGYTHHAAHAVLMSRATCPYLPHSRASNTQEGSFPKLAGSSPTTESHSDVSRSICQCIMFISQSYTSS